MQGSRSFKFELLEKLGAGSFGSVYSSMSERGIPVAVKKLTLDIEIIIIALFP